MYSGIKLFDNERCYMIGLTLMVFGAAWFVTRWRLSSSKLSIAIVEFVTFINLLQNTTGNDIGGDGEDSYILQNQYGRSGKDADWRAAA